MEIKYKNKIAIISDTSEIATKIKNGYDFEITDDGNIIIKKQGIEVKTKWQLAKRIEKIKDIEDIKKVLKEFAEIIN